MALRARQVPIFVSGGIDTKTDPRVIPAGSLIEIENMYYQRTGELRLRNGYSSKTTNGNAPTSLDNLFSLPSGALECFPSAATSITNSRPKIKLGSSSSVAKGWSGAEIGQFSQPYPAAVASFAGVEGVGQFNPGSSADLTDGDVCSTDGKTLVIWRDIAAAANRISWVLLDRDTGMQLLAPQATDTPPSGRCGVCCASGTGANARLCIFLIDSVFNVRVHNLTGNGVDNGSTNIVVGGAHLTQPWIDVKALSSGNMIVAWRLNAGGVSFLEYNPITQAVVTGPVNVAAIDATMCLGWLDDSLATGNYYIASAGATSGVVVRTLNTAFAVAATNVIDAAATTNVRNITGHINTSATNYVVLWDINGAPTYTMLVRLCRWTGSAALFNFEFGMGLYSRSYKAADGKYYVLSSYDSTVQAAYVVLATEDLQLTSASIQSVIMPGYAGGRRIQVSSLSSVFTDSSGSNVVACPRKQRLTTATGTTLIAQRAMTLGTIRTSTAALRRPREAGGTVYFPGGIAMKDDGRYTSWATFPLALEMPSLASSAGGSMTSSGAYSYVLVLRRVDSTGKLTRSPQSAPVAITLGPADTEVTITYTNMPLMIANAEEPTIEVYRSGPAAIGVTNYNKVGEVRNQFNLVGSGTFVDTVSDVTANTGEPLYTTGNVLENFVSPSCSLMETTGARVWIVNAEYPSELWYSKEIKQGFGIGFHPLQTLRLEGDGYGAITALAAMDGRLIAFKSNAIYVISGDGPNDLGQGTFNPPQAVSLNVGTVLPGSVVATPDGIMFQAAAGMFLLTRGLSVTYVGKPVEQYTLAANVVDASRVSGTTQIRFVMANGRCLVWDYGVVGAPQPGIQAPPGMWTTFLLAVGGSTVVACADAPGGWCYALANGTVNQETPGVFTDPGNLAIVPRVGFPHLALANIAGFQRVQGIEILGEFVGNHTLSAQFEYDYSGGVTETRTKAITAGAYLYGVLTAKQKCTALKLTLTTSAQAAGSGAFRLTGVNLLVAGKAGQFTLPPGSFLT